MKDRTVCKSCYNKTRRKNNNNQQPKIYKTNINNDNNHNVSAFENHAYVVIGPRNVGKTYYMLRMLEKIVNKRPVHIITLSPNQYPNYKTSIDSKPIHKHKGSVVFFDDMLRARNSSQMDEFLTRRRHDDLDVFYISQS